MDSSPTVLMSDKDKIKKSSSAAARFLRLSTRRGSSASNNSSTVFVDGSIMASLDTAIRLVTQAVSQDTKKNYQEAARCYREAIVIFRTVARAKGVSKRVSSAIEAKTGLYEARLRKLDRHLLSKADLTNLFREVVKTYSESDKIVNRSGSDADEEEDARSDSSSSGGSHNSVNTEVLYENPSLQKGLDTIAKAKREDTRSHFPEAIHFYEQGAGLLLDAVRKGRVGERHAEVIRIKCLLVHDRCELIRNHLENGSPLKVRKDCLDSFESSLEGSPESGSPLPLDAEEQTLLMEEVHSQASVSVAGSLHSLYPNCEIKRSPSGMSGISDFHNVSVVPAPRKDMIGAPIPLANMDSELNLSALSINSRISRQTAASTSASVAAVAMSNRSQANSLEDLVHHHVQVEVQQHARPASRLLLDPHGDDSDGILVVDEHGRLTDLSCSFEERDRNVTEVTLMNSGVGEDLFKQYMIDQDVVNGRDSGSSHQQDSGSDSGFSDPSQDTVASKSPALSDDGRKSHLSDIDSLDIVPSTPVNQSPTPSSKSGSRTPTLLVRRRRSRGSSGGGSSGAGVIVEDDLQVLSEDTVVNGRLLPADEIPLLTKKNKVRVVEPEVYSKSTPQVRDEYIPPRATARRMQDQRGDRRRGDEDMNQGCYYFVSCLDSFWIL